MLPEANTNRNLTIITPGVLTINDNINLGTGTLTLNGASFTFGAGAMALSAGDFSLPFTCDATSTPTCTVNSP